MGILGYPDPITRTGEALTPFRTGNFQLPAIGDLVTDIGDCSQKMDQKMEHQQIMGQFASAFVGYPRKEIEAVPIGLWFGHATEDTNIIICSQEFVCIDLCPSKSSLCAMLRLLWTVSNYRWIRLCHGVSSSLMWLSTTWWDCSVSPLCHGDDVTFPRLIWLL